MVCTDNDDPSFHLHVSLLHSAGRSPVSYLGSVLTVVSRNDAVGKRFRPTVKTWCGGGWLRRGRRRAGRDFGVPASGRLGLLNGASRYREVDGDIAVVLSMLAWPSQ